MNALLGIRLSEASARTGLTVKQLRYLACKDRIRWRLQGRLLIIHPEDVGALAASAWNGAPFTAKTGPAAEGGAEGEVHR